MDVMIQNGGRDPIFTMALLNAAGALLTGLSNVYLSIQRESDDYFLDFADMTFKAAPGSLTTTMSEVDATRAPGRYYYDFDLSNVTNEQENDVYVLRATCASAVNAPQECSIRTDDLAARSGWGSYTFTATVEDESADAIAGATVQIRNSDGSVIVAANMTDADGEAAFLLDDGTYKVYLAATGYSFDNPYSLTISGDASATYEGEAVSDITAPSSPDVCRVYGYCRDLGGNALADIKVRAELSSKSAYLSDASDGTVLAKTAAATKTDANGLWYLDLIPNADIEVEPGTAVGQASGENDTTYTFYFDGPSGFKREYRKVTVPDQATADLKDLI